jgi:HD superfamily phosphohydrolase
MNKRKIFNDPVYGFVTIPYPIVFDLIEHPFYQRLRRIKQLGLTHYVYPGALHTRFHHAIGACHLMAEAIEVLRGKGVKISDKEAVAASVAILLHDVGHGPFSHTLEHSLINVHHEELSVLFMEKLNEEFDGQLTLAIQIFKDKHPKKFLHQLISGQLDMDRMDYLNRDSFFTGVHEGVIGSERIIKMLAVKDDCLVVEEKGIYSIEKFLIARRLMYWQVYLHKTVLGAEQMLVQTLARAKTLASKGVKLEASENLSYFLYQNVTSKDFENNRAELLDRFSKLDDFDIISALKNWTNHDDFTLSYLAKSIINRRLFKIWIQDTRFDKKQIKELRQSVETHFNISKKEAKYLVFTGKETNRAYNIAKDEIKILFKNGEVKPWSKSTDMGLKVGEVKKFYLCFPKEVMKH